MLTGTSIGLAHSQRRHALAIQTIMRSRAMTQSTKEFFNEPPTMTIPQVAAALQCCDRHIFDLRQQNRMPQPTTVGKKKGVRWSRQVIEEWIESGCPALAV